MTEPDHDGQGAGAGVLPLAACERLCQGLPGAASLDAALTVIESARALALGPGLLTVHRDASDGSDPAGELRLERLWTSMPGAYPVGGAKRKTRSAWTRQLFGDRRLFVGEGDAALAAVFDDHAAILALDLHAVVNVPVLRGGRCVATFNALGVRPAWQPQELAAVRLLALLATPHILAELDRLHLDPTA